MSVLRILQLVSIVFFALTGAQYAAAKDLSTLQSAVTYAREDMDKAQADHEASKLALAQQQKIVEERKKQLADETRKMEKMQKDTDRAWKQYQDAKQKFDREQAILDEAWRKK